jgi:hypothetical protein
MPIRRPLALFLSAAVFVALLVPGVSKAVTYYYTYANNDAEYTVDLPEAPRAVTIWADDKENPVPFIDEPPKNGPVGETAFIKKVDQETGDIYTVEITFVKADREFLLTMTRERMEKTLEEVFKEISLEQKKVNFSAGTDTLKWATLTGFSTDENNNYLYHAVHYLTGMESVIMIKAEFNVENKKFHDYYQTMASSIKFTGK